ncbi:hypothetical protein RHMOL_Rhmol02G0244600 [Rhododendron molle]|uniref:Uncharacterized protein n=1 Tax=Rhododendron molle TaxID=49168 RepID=A0ACC0PW39_RHOML|nr:hypothetical protein RHMOL_Rhmol02G0244600 [Rhododendron molle]
MPPQQNAQNKLLLLGAPPRQDVKLKKPYSDKKKPPDIITYHEFARASECNRELSQGEHGDRFRHRSRSPNKSSLVARGGEVQSQTLRPVLGDDSQPHCNLETNGPSGLSQESDLQASGLA